MALVNRTLAVAAFLFASRATTVQAAGFFEPGGPGAGRVGLAASGLVDVLPTALVESEARVIPRVRLHGRVGLRDGLFAEAIATGNLVHNDAHVGIGWGVGDERVRVGIYERAGAWFGWVGIAGFDATASGYLNTTGLSVGIAVPNGYLTFGAEVALEHARTLTVGNQLLRRGRSHITAVSAPITLVGNSGWFCRMTLLYAKPDHQMWLVFADTETRSLYPRFEVGHVF